MTLKISQGAEEDIANAVSWYNEQRDDLGYEFLDALQLLLEMIEVGPKRFQVVESPNPSRQFRHALVRRFPYRVIFELQSDHSVLVLAVPHTRRHPDFWQRHLEN